MTSNKPTRKLALPGQSLWDRIVNAYEVEDEGGREVLTLACEAIDRAEEMKKQIAKDGLLLTTKTGFRDHPLIRHELAARAFVTKTLVRLGLDMEPLRPHGRPTNGGLGITDIGRPQLRRRS